MAINTQKLLPPSKSGALTVKSSKISLKPSVSSLALRDEKDEKKGGSLVKSERGVLSKEILQMKKKVLKLQGAVESGKKENQKEEEGKRKVKEKEERGKREKKLEGGIKGISIPKVTPSLPGGSIVDMIKRYLGFTFLGWLLGKYEELMPKLEKFMGIAKNVFNGLVFTVDAVVKGVFAFVDAGYKAYDTITSSIKKLGGENAEKIFSDFSGHLNKLLNGAIVAAMLLISTAPKKPGKPTRPTPTAPGGSKPALPQAKGPRAPGQARAGGFALEQARKKATQTSLPPAAKPAPKGPGGSRFGKFGGGRIPIIGPLITLAIRTIVYKEPIAKAATAAVGMGIGQAIGTFIGGLGAGALGLGTFGLGAVVAPLIIGAGSIIGGLIGEWIGAALYDFIAASSGKNKNGSKKASGGTVSSGSTKVNVRKKVASKKQRIKVVPQQTQPGKNIGGRHKVEEYYGREKVKPSDPTDTRTTGQVIVKQLEKASTEVKKLPLDWVASLGGAFMDMTLGQKPDRKVSSDIAKSFGSFTDTLLNNEISLATNEITKALVGMANGGSVPETLDPDVRKSISERVEKNIQQRLQTIFDQAANTTLNNIKAIKDANEIRDMQRRSQARQRGGGGGGGGGGADPAADYTDIVKIDMGGFSQEDIDALGRMIAAEAGGQSDIGKAAVLSVILNRYRLAKAGNAGYMPDGKNKKTVTIKDILYDAGQFSPISDGRFDRTSSAAGKNALADAIAASGNDPQKFKKLLMEKKKLSEADAETVVRATAFSNPRTRGSKPFSTPEVAIGDHSFQESPYSRIGAFPGAISAKVQKLDLSMEGLEKGAQMSRRDAATGKYGQVSSTGGDPYADLDGQETGVNIELFGSRGKIGRKFGDNSAQGPYGNRGVEISLPYELIYYDKIPGGINAGKPSIDVNATTNRVVKGQGPGGFGHVGSYFYRDPRDGKLYEIMFAHGNKPFKKFKNGEKIPAGTVIGYQGASGSSDDGSGGLYDHISLHVNAVDGGNRADAIIKQFTNSMLNGEGAKITLRARESAERKSRLKGDTKVYEALSKKGNIGFSLNGQRFFFKMKPDGTYDVFRTKNIFGYQEPIDITGQKNRDIKKAVQNKISTMYVSQAMGNRQTAPTTLNAVQGLLNMTDIPKGVSLNQSSLLKEFVDNRKIVGINLGAGHQGPGGQGTEDPLTGVKEHEAVLHMLTAIKKIIQEKDPDLAKKTTFTSFQNDNYAKDNAKYFTKLQKQMIELHFDQFGGAGRSGVIASRGRRYGVTSSEGSTSALDIALMKRFGNFGKSFKLDDLGIADTGGTILELGAIDSMPALMKEIKSGKFGPETMKLARYTYLGIREGAEKEGLVKPMSPEKLAEALGVPKKEKKETKPSQVQDLSKVKPSKTTKVMQGQTEVTLYGPNDPRRNVQKNRAWWDPRRLVGMQGGGSTAQMASQQPASSYSSLNNSGSLKTETLYNEEMVIMVQKEIIMT